MKNREKIIQAVSILRNYFGEHDRTIEQHTLFAIAEEALALLREGEEGRSEGEGHGDAEDGPRSTLVSPPSSEDTAAIAIAPAHKENQTCLRTVGFDNCLGGTGYDQCGHPVKWILRQLGIRAEIKEERVCGKHMQVSKKYHERCLARGYDTQFTCEQITH